MRHKIILLSASPKKHPVIYVIFFIILITSLSLSFFIKTYSTYQTTGIIKCESTCEISITLPYNKTDILNGDSKIRYLNQEFEIEEVSYEEPYLNNGTPYEDVTIKANIKTQSKIVNFQILYNKQRIIEKIKEILIERN